MAAMRHPNVVVRIIESRGMGSGALGQDTGLACPLADVHCPVPCPSDHFSGSLFARCPGRLLQGFLGVCSTPPCVVSCAGLGWRWPWPNLTAAKQKRGMASCMPDGLKPLFHSADVAGPIR